MNPFRFRVPVRALPCAVICLLLCSGLALAAADVPRLRIARITEAPRLDDVAAGKAPSGMTKVTGFAQREPRDGEPVSRETTAYLGYDDTSLHVVFVCKEESVRGHMAKRESINGDDMVAVILDTFHDHRHGYEFFVNPLGVQMDGIATDGQNDDVSFDTLWHSEGRLTPDGFVVSMRIPFRSLRFKDADVQEWGIALARMLPVRNETSFWPPMTRRISSQIEQMAHLEGLERISPGRNLQFIPYTAFTGARYLDESALAYGDKKEGRVGLDAKMVVKDALTVDLALNPDFSQVESDEPQVTINQRYEVQFPEKRPFFIENANYFSTPEELFFSRRVADPRFGARLTGRVGKWTVAGLVMDDRAPGDQASPSIGAGGKATVAAVGRVVREFARQSTVGVLVTSRDFAGSSSRVGSADLRLRLGDNVTVNGQAIASETVRLDGTRLSGPAFNAGAGYDSRSLRIDTTYTDRSPGFRSDLGFITRSDIRRWNTEASYTFYPKGKTVTSWGPSLEASVIWDHRQRLQDWEVHPEVEIELPASTMLHLQGTRAYELYEGIGFDKSNAGFFFETQRLKWLWLNASFFQGRAINYYPAAGQAPFLASSRELESGLTLRPLPSARIEETYIYNALSTNRSAQPSCDCPGGGASVFRLHMLRTKANYQFTRELSLRAIVDYNVLTPNAAFVTLDRDKRFTMDLLVTYLLNPGTALYVGVTDAYANLRLNPTLPPWARRTGEATTSTGRQFFVKLSYLLRY